MIFDPFPEDDDDEEDDEEEDDVVRKWQNDRGEPHQLAEQTLADDARDQLRNYWK